MVYLLFILVGFFAWGIYALIRDMNQRRILECGESLLPLFKASDELETAHDVQTFNRSATKILERIGELERWRDDPVLLKLTEGQRVTSKQFYTLINSRVALITMELFDSYAREQESSSLSPAEHRKALRSLQQQFQGLSVFLRQEGDFHEEARSVLEYRQKQTEKFLFTSEFLNRLKSSHEAAFTGDGRKAKERYLKALHLVITSGYPPEDWDVAHWQEAFDESDEAYERLIEEVDTLLDRALGLKEAAEKIERIGEKED